MTLWRQDGNGEARRGPQPWRATVLALLLAGFWDGAALAQATTERVVINRVSGYAISGFDPVAYFTDGGPLPGQEQYETVHDSAVWRFRNEGNLNAFRRHPAVYAPLFGGYDPTDLAEGKTVEGHPQIWAIVASHLVLFASEENRTRLLGEPAKWLPQAERNWPALRTQLAP